MNFQLVLITCTLGWFETLADPVNIELPADAIPYIGVTNILPQLVFKPTADIYNTCKNGSASCYNQSVNALLAAYNDLVYNHDCDHKAVFALAYSIIEGVEQNASVTTLANGTLAHTNFYREPVAIAHGDTVFVFDLYLNYLNYWQGNATSPPQRDRVPKAWQIAFQDADDRKLCALANLLQALAAHVMGDEPILLYGTGLVAADGVGIKLDYDNANALLSKAYGEINPTVAAQLDPTITNTNIQNTTVDDFLTFQMIPALREYAWRKAEALVLAPNSFFRNIILQEIETNAAVMTTIFGSICKVSADRDNYCRTRHNITTGN
jgi:hypothetical protein